MAIYSVGFSVLLANHMKSLIPTYSNPLTENILAYCHEIIVLCYKPYAIKQAIKAKKIAVWFCFIIITFYSNKENIQLGSIASYTASNNESSELTTLMVLSQDPDMIFSLSNCTQSTAAS